MAFLVLTLPSRKNHLESDSSTIIFLCLGVIEVDAMLGVSLLSWFIIPKNLRSSVGDVAGFFHLKNSIGLMGIRGNSISIYYVP